MPETIKKGDRGAATRNLQTLLNVIGADLAVDGDFGKFTEEAVLDFQAWQHLPETGVVDDKVWDALNRALLRRQHMDRIAREDRLRVLGETAVKHALELWAKDIYDPTPADHSADAERCKAIISGFIHNGLGWRWEPEYAGDGDFEWCLAFVSECWPDIKETLRVIYGASTYRWDRFGAYRSAFGEPNPMPEAESHRRLYMKCDDGTRVEELEWEPRPGDIALVGKAGYGTHGVLVERFDKERGCIHTIEGNANGAGPHGEHQQGVIKNVRYFGGYVPANSVHVRRVVRPGLDDLRP